MLYDQISIKDIVDSEAAHEFLLEATRLASSAELEDIGRRLERKSELFRKILAPDQIDKLEAPQLKALFAHIFFLRRKSSYLLKNNSVERIREEIKRLLYDDKPIDQRFDRFTATLLGMDEIFLISLAGELLHYSHPDTYWLWTNWIWDPRSKTGALPLVLQKEIDLSAESHGKVYENIGRATAMINAAGHAEGYSNLAGGLYGTNVFLACVYAVYMYTVFRLKLSKEFNRILPELPELARRVLGVQKMETESYAA